MANTLSKTGITNGQTIQPSHVTQSIDAFTGTEAYDITLSGSLTLDVNGGYQMTASSGNYTSVIDPGTTTLPNGASLTNANGSFTTFYGTYVPITSSLLNGESIADSVISASGFINEVKYGVDVNQQYCAYQDFSLVFANPPGTNVNFVNQISLIDDGDTNYGVTIGDSVFAGGAKGVYIQGNDASNVGASLLINETFPSGFIITSNDANATGSVLLTIARNSDGATFFITRNDGMIILSQLSSSFSASDDADAATKGVPTGGLYHTNGTVKIRLS